METHFQFGPRIGVPQPIGGAELTPESLVLLLRLGPWGYVWNWPLAVTLAWPPEARGPGSPALVQRYPIRDVTRLALWTLAALSAFVVLAALLRPAARRSESRTH
jgi:hypothetical protein